MVKVSRLHLVPGRGCDRRTFDLEPRLWLDAVGEASKVAGGNDKIQGLVVVLVERQRR